MRLYMALFLLWTTSMLSQKNADPCAMGSLPAGVQELVVDKYPGLRPKALSDLEGYDRKLWVTSNPHACPGVAVGNFEEASQRGFAILLIPKSGVEEQYKVVVIAQSKGSRQYHLSVLDHGISTPNSGLVISKVPPGKQTGFDESKSIRLKLDGIDVEWLEKSSVLYYYSGGRYHELQTSD
ncbi:MAG: hypothetical protein ACRD3P_11225 [Terriglobales bacterium]